MDNAFVKKLRRIADLTADEILALVKITAQPARIPAKRDLIREGDRTGPMFVILEGWACRYKILPSGVRQIMAFLLPGDSCDLHNAMLGEMDHSLQTLTDATVAAVPGDVLLNLMQTYPRISRALYKSQLIDESTLRAWIVSMGRRSSTERVAHLMCELYLRSISTHQMSRDHVALPISQIVLADALGMTPVHINRVLRDLRLRGAMELRRGSLRIIDPTRLVQIAGFDENYLHRRRGLVPELEPQ